MNARTQRSHLIVNLLTVPQRCRQQGQQAVGACLWVSVQVGQGLLTPRLYVGQGPSGALVRDGQTQCFTNNCHVGFS